MDIYLYYIFVFFLVLGLMDVGGSLGGGKINEWGFFLCLFLLFY